MRSHLYRELRARYYRRTVYQYSAYVAQVLGVVLFVFMLGTLAAIPAWL